MNDISIRGLSKTYSTGLIIHKSRIGLYPANLDIPKGSIYCILGPNGAGKTTLLSLLSTLIIPTSGTATILGNDLLKNPSKIRRKIGVVFQDSVIDGDLTPYQMFYLQTLLYGCGKENINRFLKLAGLYSEKDTLIKTFSGGMKRKVEMIRGIVHDPEILLLDEPTLGLDPSTRIAIWDYLRKVNSLGKTILLATNYMEEAASLSTHIAIISKGKISFHGSKDMLLSKAGKKQMIVKVKGKKGIGTFTKKIVYEPGFQEKIKQLLLQDEVLDIDIHTPTLQDAYLKLTGEEMK